MKSILTSISKEIYLISRTKMLYFLLITTIAGGILIPLYYKTFVENLLEVSSFSSTNDLLSIIPRNRMYLSLYTYTIFMLPLIVSVFTFQLFHIDEVSQSRRLKYVMFDYNNIHIAKLVITVSFIILSLGLLIITSSISGMILFNGLDVTTYVPLVPIILYKEIIILFGSAILGSVIIGLLVLTLKLVISNLVAILVVILSTIYILPVFVTDLKFQYIGLYKSILGFGNTEIIGEYLQTDNLLNGSSALLVLLVIAIVLITILRGGLKWQEKY